jgi:amino acid adenylation domain-containing protein
VTVPADAPEALPLTAAQTEAWLAHELDPASPANNLVGAFELTGPHDVDLLRRAYARAWQEAGTLDAVFVDGPDGPRQHRPHGPVDLPVLDLRSAPDPRAAYEAWARVDRLRSPALRQAGHTAAALVRLDETHTVAYGHGHHSTMDGYAWQLVVERTAAVYDAWHRGQEPPPSPFAPVADFVAADRAYRGSPENAADRAHWLAYCADRPPRADLASWDGAPTPGAVRVTRELGDGEPAGLAALGRRLRTAWSAVFTAAVAAYLCRRTGARELLLGVPVTGRVGAEARRTCLTASNIVPLRVRCGPDTTVGELVSHVARDLRQGLRHQRHRIEHLRRDLGVGADDPLFTALVNIHHGNRGLRFGEALAECELPAIGAVDDFSVSAVQPAPDRLAVPLDGNAGRYDAGGLAAEADAFAAMLTAFAGADPDTPVAGAAPVAVPSHADALDRWNATAAPVPGACLHELVREQVRRTPDALAVSDDTGGELTYRELDRRANALAHRLARAGAGPEVPVGVLLERSVDLAVAVLAVLKAGAAYLPLDPDGPLARARTLQREAAAPLCVARPGAGLGDADGVRLVGLDAHAAEERPEPPRSGVTPDNLVSVFFTSGSTGVPKGAANTHAGWVNRLWDLRVRHPLADGEVVLQKTAPGFDDSAVELFWPLLSGGTCHFLAPGLHRDPAAIVRAAAERRVVALFFVPVVLGLFLDEVTPRVRAGLGALREVFTSGEALPPDLVARFFDRLGGPGRRLHNHWGVTESSIDSTVHTCTPRDADGSRVPVGLPLGNCALHVLDAAMRPAPVGTVGEIHVSGAGVGRGYRGDPARTAASFVPDPFGHGGRLYRTGDRGVRRPNGEVVFLGRADGQLKIGGVRVEPAEIEQTLRAHPAVSQAVVVKRPVGDGEALTAFVVPADGMAFDPAALTEFAADRLPPTVVPSLFHEVTALPLTPSGKVDRRALESLPVADAGRRPAAAPRTETERLVAEVVCGVLGLPEIDPHLSFFALGGSSVMAMRAVSKLRRASGVRVPVALLFQHPTVADLAAAVDALRPPAAPSGTEETAGALALSASPTTG